MPLLLLGLGSPAWHPEGKAGAFPGKGLQYPKAETRARSCSLSPNFSLESGFGCAGGISWFQQLRKELGMYSTMSLRKEAQRGKCSTLQGRNAKNLPQTSLILQLQVSGYLLFWDSVQSLLGGTEQSAKKYRTALQTPGIFSQGSCKALVFWTNFRDVSLCLERKNNPEL